MRFLPLIVAALLTSACERPAGPLSLGKQDVVARQVERAPAPSAPAQPPPAAAPGAMPPREALTDSAITEKIRTALASDPGLAGADVSINTDHGVVVLAGTVKSHEQSGVASAHAQRQDGVMRVDNQLRLALS